MESGVHGGVERGRSGQKPGVMERQGKSGRRQKGPQQGFRTAALVAGSVEGMSQRLWDRRPERHCALSPKGD